MAIFGNSRILNCYIKTLTPLHIYSGHDYRIGSYRMNDSMFEYTGDDSFLEFMPYDVKSKIINSETTLTPHQMLSFPEEIPFSLRTIPVSRSFQNRYEEEKNGSTPNARNLKTIEVKRHSFLPDFRPYIPGSSVKGAFRTLVLSLRANEKEFISNNKKGYEFEQFLLGLDKNSARHDFYQDPFSCLSVSDFLPFGDAQTKIVKTIRHYLKDNKQGKDLGEYEEVVLKESMFIGSISSGERYNTTNSISDSKFLLDEIFSPKCSEYLYKLLDQYISGLSLDISNPLLKYLLNDLLKTDPAKSNRQLLRLGRHQGRDFLTYPKSVIARYGNQSDSKAVVTASLIEGDRSFMNSCGWIEFGILKSPDDLHKYKQEEIKWQKKWGDILREVCKCRSHHAQKINKEREFIEIIQTKQENSRKRLDELSSLSDYERCIYELDEMLAGKDKSKVNENFVNDFAYKYLKTTSDKNERVNIGNKLKEIYELLGKWDGKLTTKQEKKVAAIKSILKDN